MNNFRRRTLSGGVIAIAIDPTTGRGTIGDYEVVDLGLPSGLLWATCNVGATKEEEYGDYKYWGLGYTAIQAMGEGWSMPTSSEMDELFDYTIISYSWVTNFKGSGINGYKFTSKTNPNAYVFFPAAGYYNATSYGNSGDLTGLNEIGHVWCSSYSGSDDYHTVLNFAARQLNRIGCLNYVLMSVRGVYSGTYIAV